MRLLSLLFLFLLPGVLLAQPAPDRAPLRVFVDCERWQCDFDYLRTEITFVDYMRDRQDADVHVLVTTERTGGGGQAYTLDFIGQRRFATLRDTLAFTTQPTDTEAETRVQLANLLKAGLLRYVSRTPLLSRMRITYDAPAQQEQAAQVEVDPWNYWVFRLSLNGFGSGESRFSQINAFGDASASRVTEDWKIRLSTSGSRRSQTFTLSDGSEEQDVQRSYGARASVVRSLGDQLSAGFFTSVNSSTHSNHDLAFSAAPGVEYDFFPYDRSTRELVALRYAIGPRFFDYTDTTLFNKTRELLVQHSLELRVEVKQTWGSIDAAIEGQQYLHDPSKLGLELGGGLELRVFRGFNFEIGGEVEMVRDQLSLRKGSASDEDVLLRRRELETNWRYFFHMGLSYTFGSKFNNVVNPRFNRWFF